MTSREIITKAYIRDEDGIKELRERFNEIKAKSFYIQLELEIIVERPWGSYIVSEEKFFIPPVRKPYEPDCVQFSGRSLRDSGLGEIRSQTMSYLPFEGRSILEVAKMFSDLGDKTKYQTASPKKKKKIKKLLNKIKKLL